MTSQNSAGAVYISYGKPAAIQARLSIKRLRRLMPWLPVVVIGDAAWSELTQMPLVTQIEEPEYDPGGRWIKVGLFWSTPFEHTVYLDADTRPHEDLSAGFAMLDDGWEIVIATSECQGQRSLWHVSDAEREETLFAWPLQPLQLQGGVIFFRKTAQTGLFFRQWRHEWLKHQDQDQGALLRALAVAPVKLWLLGRPWNGGPVINHLYGRAKRHG